MTALGLLKKRAFNGRQLTGVSFQSYVYNRMDESGLRSDRTTFERGNVQRGSTARIFVLKMHTWGNLSPKVGRNCQEVSSIQVATGFEGSTSHNAYRRKKTTMRTFCTDEGRFRSLIWLMLAAKVVVEGLHMSPYTLGRSRFSTKLCSAENQQPSSPMYGEDEDFLQLFQETSMEGIGLAREFNRQQLQRQAQLREEQERLEE
eukprot:scaffold24617_cov137-Cylindrotheca_fusiformis.AAC.3